MPRWWGRPRARKPSIRAHRVFAGAPSQVLVLGTPHLSGLPKSFKPEDLALADTAAVLQWAGMADIAFDPLKNETNLEKHGLALAFGGRLFDDPHHLVLPSIREIDGEERYKVIGLVDKKLYTGVHVRRDRARRFISVRRSNDGEARLYRRSGG